VAEHAYRERLPEDDEPRRGGWIGELRFDRRVQDEIAERAVAVPTLVARLRNHPPRPGVGLELRPGLEPLDPPQTVAGTPRPLRLQKVGGEHLDVTGSESERREPGAGLLRRQAAASA